MQTELVERARGGDREAFAVLAGRAVVQPVIALLDRAVSLIVP